MVREEKGCMARRREGEDQAKNNKGILSRLSSPSLFFSLDFFLCVLLRAPAAFPSWFHSKVLDMSQTGQVFDYASMSLCVYLTMDVTDC